MLCEMCIKVCFCCPYACYTKAGLAAPAQEGQPRTYGTPQGEGTGVNEGGRREGGGAVDTPAAGDDFPRA